MKKIWIVWAVLVMALLAASLAGAEETLAGGTASAPAQGPEPLPSAPDGPQIAAKVSLMVKVADGALLGFADVSYALQNNAAVALSLSLPDDVTIGAVQGQLIKERRQELRDQRRFLTVLLEQPVAGDYRLYLEFERVTDSDNRAQVAFVRPETITIAATQREAPVGTVTAADGYVGVTVIQSLEVGDQQVTNLRRIDPSQLRGSLFELSESLVQFAYSYTWSRNVGKEPDLSFSLIRHEDVAVKDAFIDEARYLTMVSPEGFGMTKAVFSVRNKNHHSLKLKLPPGSELWSAFLADQPVPVVKDNQDRLLITLPKSDFTDSGDLTNFPVEVVYRTKLEPIGSYGRLAVPLPLTDIIVAKSRWHLYLPRDWTYRSFSGTMGPVMEERKSEKDIADELKDFALGLTGNFLKFQARSKQSESRTNLGAIFTAQMEYHRRYDSYAPAFRDLGWAPEGRNSYTYIMGRDRILGVRGNAEFTQIEGTAVDGNSFLALAIGNIDNDPFPDIWAINQEKKLVNLANDVSDAYSPDFDDYRAQGLLGEFDLQSLLSVQEHLRQADLRGMLSIKIDVPAEGLLVRFEKLFPGSQGEDLAVTVKYMPAGMGKGARFLGRIMALGLAALALAGAAVLVRRSERLAFVRRHWWLTVLALIGILILIHRLWIS